MLSYEESLKILKETNALLEGHFILSSGLHSRQYIQCAKLLSIPKKAEIICSSLCEKIKKKFNNIDIILSPAIGGIVVGYEVGRQLDIETIFSERVENQLILRRGFEIKKNQRVLIVEDVITTGKSSLECSKIISKAKGKLIGFACLIDRSDKSKLKIKKKKIVSQVKINVPTYSKNKLPEFLKKIPISKPGSRFLIKW